MIPLYKLQKLPRMQKLRKIAKFFTMAENRLSMAAEKKADIFSVSELVFFADAVKLFTCDTLFSVNTKKVLNESLDVFNEALNQKVEKKHDEKIPEKLRRALNNVKHILLNETGRDQADWDFINADGTLNPEARKINSGMFVYLEDIRSPFNVGAMFRTAESFGAEKIYLSPLCADPRHRRAERTAMGCIDIMAWERKELFSPSSEQEQIELPVFALETGGVPITEFQFPPKGILIAGSEELGVSPCALEAADASLGRVSIPILGTKASINVSVAFGIALHAWSAAIR